MKNSIWINNASRKDKLFWSIYLSICLLFLLGFSLISASYKSIYNPFTGKLDFVQRGSHYPADINLTSGTYNGALVNGSKRGYDAGNAICNAEFSGSSLCTNSEILIWFANEDSPSVSGDAWCSTGGPKYVPADIPVNDCHGWTYSGTASYLGNYWHFNSTTGGEGRAINCGTTLKLACCTY